MRFSPLLLTLLIPCSPLFAATECTPIDLSAGFGPARDQYDTNWCGSVVATDLLSFFSGTRLGVVSVGTNYYARRSVAEERLYNTALRIAPGEYGGASLASALRQNLAWGACREADVPDRALEHGAADIFADITARRTGARTTPMCARPVALSTLNLRVRGRDWWPNPDLGLIHAQLSAHRPVAATVENDRLFDTPPFSDIRAVQTFGDHFVIVAGRRRVAGRCQLLIRNSWGEDCARYGRAGIASCDRGHLWIEESHVRAALKNVIYLEPRP